MSPIHEIRLVGRGGQGVVTAGEVIGTAALREGRWAQSMPTFGPERRGALCTATLRIGDDELLLKCAAAQPAVVLVLDPSIWKLVNVMSGLRSDAVLIFNSSKPPETIAEALVDLGQVDGRRAKPLYRIVRRSGAVMIWSELVDDTGAEGRLSVDGLTIHTVDATGIALETLGKPITNTAMIGAYVGATGVLSMEAVEAALHQRFGAQAERNIEAARSAHAAVSRRVA